MKTCNTVIILFCLLVSTKLFCQVSIGANAPDSSSLLELKSTTKGFLPPRMTSEQRDSIQNPAIGLMIFNLDCHCVNFFNGDSWVEYGRDPVESFICGNVMTDSRTGKSYNTIRTGSQCWMAENLDVGEMIQHTDSPGDNGIIEKYCYGDAPVNSSKYGGLYTWQELMQYDSNRYNQGICPSGWHLPNADEWDTLANYYGGQSSAGISLREEGNSGFEALLGGGMNPDGSFHSKGTRGYFWSSALSSIDSAWSYLLSGNDDGFYKQDTAIQNAYSVRCIKGHENRADTGVVIIDSTVYTLISDSAELAQGIYQYTFAERSRDDIIVSGNIIVGLTGYGYIRKVDYMNQSGNQLTLETSQASMEEVFLSGEFSAQTSLGATENREPGRNIWSRTYVRYLAKGVALDQTRGGFEYDFTDVSLIDNDNISLTLNGSTSFDPDVDMQFKFKDGKVKKLGFTAMEAPFINTIDLELEAGSGINLNQDITLAEVETYFYFQAGPVPVVIVLNVALVASSNISIDASFSANTGITNSNNISFGIIYENGSWKNIWELEKTNTLDPVTWSGQVNLGQRFDIVPEVSIKVYGVAGPYFNIDLYESFNFNLAVPSLDWNSNLNIGIESNLGAEITIFSYTLAQYNIQLFGFEKRLWETPHIINAFSGNNQSGGAGQALADPVVVKIEDNLGITYANIPVHFAVTQGGGSISEDKVFTSSDGYAHILWTLGPEMGTNLMTASVYNANGTQITASPLEVSAIALSGYATVTTASVTGITDSAGTCGGEVLADGGNPVTARGVCWDTSESPTIDDFFTVDGSGLGTFISEIEELDTNTLYYVRAYATNNMGTSYGSQVEFNTLAGGSGDGDPCPDLPTVTYGGQVYNTVQIGSQCWLKENLNVGSRIDGIYEQTNNSSIEKYCYNNLPSNCNVYGGLYQWNEAMQYVTTDGAQGICPPGWHIPSDNPYVSEWNDLANYLGGHSLAGGKMKEEGYVHWLTPNTNATNEIEFTGLPGGGRYPSYFTGISVDGTFWSSTESVTGGSYAWPRILYYNQAVLGRYDRLKNWGFSVRCIKNN